MVLAKETNISILKVSLGLALSGWLPLFILGRGSLGLHSRAPEVCEDLWLAEGRHARGEGDLSPNCRGGGVPLLTPALCFLEFFCQKKESNNSVSHS